MCLRSDDVALIAQHMADDRGVEFLGIIRAMLADAVECRFAFGGQYLTCRVRLNWRDPRADLEYMASRLSEWRTSLEPPPAMAMGL